MNLQDYIDQYYDGVRSAFARAFGRTPQSVYDMLKREHIYLIVIDGDRHILTEIKVIINYSDISQ